MNNQISTVILNRNLGEVCDSLVLKLQSFGIDEQYVVDSSTSAELRSKFVNVDVDERHIAHGLRINRGFNLGIAEALKRGNSTWILCLPIDSEILTFELDSLLSQVEKSTQVAAIVPLESTSPYLPFFGHEVIKLAWNVSEGPILINSDFARRFIKENTVELFDNENYRGYLAFCELALKAYANNYGILLTSLIAIKERDDYLLRYSELMKTESLDLSKKLYLTEGKEWLSQKYGLSDRWSFENLVRLTYEEFLKRNPSYRKFGL
jgi:hypothetical protein